MIPRKGSGPQSKDQQLNLPSAMKAYDVHLGYSLPSSSPGYYLRIKWEQSPISAILIIYTYLV